MDTELSFTLIQNKIEIVNAASYCKSYPNFSFFYPQRNLLQILIQSVMETMVPKLVAEDIPLLHSLLSDVFPGVAYSPAEMQALRTEIRKVCKEMYLVYGEGDELGSNWVEKVKRISVIVIDFILFLFIDL